MHSDVCSEILLNEIVDVSNLHNKENIETVSAQTIEITNMSINCVQQDL